jgi:hypothetical protein
MNIRFLTAGLFLIAGLSSNAHAITFFGKAFSFTGSVVTQQEVRGVPSTDQTASIVIITMMMDKIEYLCENPANFNVAPGEAGRRTVYASDVISPEDITGKGKASVKITTEVPGPFTCVNPNWTFKLDTEVVTQYRMIMSVFLCTGDPRTDPDPCFNGNELTITEKNSDTIEAVCTLDSVQRNYDGTVVKGQPYTCVQTSP